MKLKDIQLSHISRYRGELMGFAMLIIVLFHVGLPRHDLFFGLKRMGNIGVDLFFFLSGMGLWFSWSKQPQFKQFIKRRFLRIYPAWLIMASLYYVPRYLQGAGSSSSVVDLMGDIFINWDFWFHDELTFWYIPATMMLYLVAPAYMHLIGKHPIYRWLPAVMMVWCVAVTWVGPIHRSVGHIEIFWSRVPIFLIGINIGQWVKERRTIEATSWWLILLTFILCLASCIYMEQQLHGRFPLFIERMIYIPLTLTAVLLLCQLFDAWSSLCNKALHFIGLISLEIYLIHSHFVLVHIERWHLHYWLTALLCIGFTLPPAWLLHKIVGWIERRIEK